MILFLDLEFLKCLVARTLVRRDGLKSVLRTGRWKDPNNILLDNGLYGKPR